jgi:DNA-directed RNA polymerase specialized sigma24 family protein
MKKHTDQIKMLLSAKRRLGYTTEELAAAMGKSPTTVKSWLAPKGSAKRREMPDSSKLLLGHLVVAAKKGKS